MKDLINYITIPSVITLVATFINYSVKSYNYTEIDRRIITAQERFYVLFIQYVFGVFTASLSLFAAYTFESKSFGHYLFIILTGVMVIFIIILMFSHMKDSLKKLTFTIKNNDSSQNGNSTTKSIVPDGTYIIINRFNKNMFALRDANDESNTRIYVSKDFVLSQKLTLSKK